MGSGRAAIPSKKQYPLYMLNPSSDGFTLHSSSCSSCGICIPALCSSIQLYEIVEREGLELFLHPYFTCSSPYIEPCPFCETGTYCPCSSSSVPISEPPAALSHVCFLYCRDRAQKTWGGEKLVPRAVWVLRHLYRIYPLYRHGSYTGDKSVRYLRDSISHIDCTVMTDVTGRACRGW